MCDWPPVLVSSQGPPGISEMFMLRQVCRPHAEAATLFCGGSGHALPKLALDTIQEIEPHGFNLVISDPAPAGPISGIGMPQ